MALEIKRRVRDNVHGTIDVSVIEDAVIAHPLFQRLRRIKQTAFLHYVFPGATHTRFEHSLGVMYLAGVAWEKIRTNQRRMLDATERNANPTPDLKIAKTLGVLKSCDEVLASDYHMQVLRLAALMHDLGHAPFSHSGERFMPTYAQVLKANPKLPSYLNAFLQERLDAGKGEKKVRHEIFSALMIDAVLTEVNSQAQNLPLKIQPRDVVGVIMPEVGIDEHSPLKFQDSHLVLHELVSGELDIDRMDYLTRDARECGVVYGVFDVGRILDGLCFYERPNAQSLHLGLNRSGLAAFEDYLRARQSMYIQVYFHKTSNSAEAMMSHVAQMIPHWSLPAALVDYQDVDEYNIEAHLMDQSKTLEDKQKVSFKKIVRDLLRDRRLWKSIVEIISKNSDVPPQIQKAYEEYNAKGLSPQIISSSNVLTRFNPQTKDHPVGDVRVPLRLVAKDDNGHYVVHNIEEHSFMYKDPNQIAIHRLYVDFKS
jgi:uncharacterized protein